MESVDLILLVLRGWLAIVIVAHGQNHLRSLDGTAGWFASIGFRQAKLQALFSGLGEIAVGAGLAAGLLTPFAVAGLVATMTIAFWSVHRFAGFFVFKRPDEGYEYVATVAIAALAVATLGPGMYSLDDAFGFRENLDGWTGLVIGASGFAVAAVQLSAFYRRPPGKEHRES